MYIQIMIKINYLLDGTEYQFSIHCNGKYLNINPIFKMMKKNVKNDFMTKVNKKRKEYKEKVDAHLGINSVIMKDKNSWYHIMLIKIMLYDLDLFDLEIPLSSPWPELNNVLPMLEEYQFSHKILAIKFYENDGQVKVIKDSTLQIICRKSDGWMNLTRAMRNCDGSKKIPSRSIANKITEMKRMWAFDNRDNQDVVNNMITDVKSNKSNLVCEYSKRDSFSNEIWVDPRIFYSIIEDCSIEFKFIKSMIINDLLFEKGNQIEYVNNVNSFKFIDEESKLKEISEITEKLSCVKEKKDHCRAETNRLKQCARNLGMTTKDISAISKPKIN